MNELEKEDIEIKKTQKGIGILFLLGIIVVVLPIVFILYVTTHFVIIHPN